MMYSASETARRASAAARNTCTTLATQADFGSRFPTASPEMKESFLMLQNASSGLCPCGKRYVEAFMWCSAHPCCRDCSKDPSSMAKSRREHNCKVAGCNRPLNPECYRCEAVELRDESMTEVALSFQHALEMAERDRSTAVAAAAAATAAAAAAAAATAAPRSGGKAKIGDIEDPEEKAEAQAAAKENRLRLAKKKRVDETHDEFQIILDHAIQMLIDSDHPEAPNLVAKKRKIEEFIENGPPKKKGGRRPKAAAAAAAAGPSSAPVPDEESEEDEDDM